MYIFSLTGEGENAFEIVHVSKTILVTHDISVEKHGKKTALNGLFGRYDILLSTWT